MHIVTLEDSLSIFNAMHQYTYRYGAWHSLNQTINLMKKYFSILAFVLFSSFNLLAQTPAVKIVFDVTSSDTLTHQAAMRHVSSMASAYPHSEFEVVIYGGALPMFMKSKSTVTKGIKGLESNKNVSFKVCASTMKRYNVDKTQLLPNIVVVPDAIIEIVTKQKEGWGYIKESQ